MADAPRLLFIVSNWNSKASSLCAISWCQIFQFHSRQKVRPCGCKSRVWPSTPPLLALSHFAKCTVLCYIICISLLIMARLYVAGILNTCTSLPDNMKMELAVHSNLIARQGRRQFKMQQLKGIHAHTLASFLWTQIAFISQSTLCILSWHHITGSHFIMNKIKTNCWN